MITKSDLRTYALKNPHNSTRSLKVRTTLRDTSTIISTDKEFGSNDKVELEVQIDGKVFKPVNVNVDHHIMVPIRNEESDTVNFISEQIWLAVHHLNIGMLRAVEQANATNKTHVLFTALPGTTYVNVIDEWTITDPITDIMYKVQHYKPYDDDPNFANLGVLTAYGIAQI